MKVCATCKIEKSVNDFSYDKRSIDGRLSRCRECSNGWDKRIRLVVLNHYGAKCKWCGETDISKLHIDHKNGDTAQDKEIYGKGIEKALHRHVYKQDCPDNYQILCKKCNMAKCDETEQEFDIWLERVYRTKLQKEVQIT